VPRFAAVPLDPLRDRAAGTLLERAGRLDLAPNRSVDGMQGCRASCAE